MRLFADSGAGGGTISPPKHPVASPVFFLRSWPSAAGLDYEVNLKAEIEIIELNGKLNQILSRHLTELMRTQGEQIRLPTRLAPATGDAQ